MKRFLYLNETAAKACGMTHEGTLFGVPAWLVITGDNEVTGCPKLPILQLWCVAVDAAMEFALYFIPSNIEVATPVSIGRKLAP